MGARSVGDVLGGGMQGLFAGLDFKYVLGKNDEKEGADGGVV